MSSNIQTTALLTSTELPNWKVGKCFNYILHNTQATTAK